MSFILFLLLIAFVVLVLRPALRIFLLYRNARRRAEEFFGSAQRASGAGAEQPRRRHAKIIDPDVGEYVEFEDLPPAPEEPKDERVEFRTETQVEDVQWEDIS